jgi:hypothetical protein
MSCAVELRNAIVVAEGCPADDATVVMITPDKYLRYKWPGFLDCIITSISGQLSPDDIEVVIDSAWAGRNYYDLPAIKDKRFRLYRDGLLLNSTQYRSLTTGGFELLLSGDILEENQIFIITQY